MNIMSNTKNMYIFTADDADIIDRSRDFPEISNGHVAWQFGNAYMYLAGLYNRRNEAEATTWRAAIPSTLRSEFILLNKSLDTKCGYTLDAYEGVFTRWIQQESYTIELRSYAHRGISQVLVQELRLVSSVHFAEAVKIQFTANTEVLSPDLELKTTRIKDGVNLTFGSVRHPEPNTEPWNLYVFYTDLTQSVFLTSKQPTYTFITSIDHSRTAAETAFHTASKLSLSNQLYELHVSEWKKLWNNGRLEICVNNDGSNSADEQLQVLIPLTVASQYYLLSAMPNENDNGPFYGLSPAGLAHGDELNYFGHVFWDQETWMLPSLMLIHPNLTQRAIDYRSACMSAAQENAKKWGNEGAQYPWESTRGGNEVCPEEIYSKNELHITADISLAVQQQLWLSHKDDTTWYNETGRRLLYETAKFWASRVTKVNDLYHINDVMPPDEYVSQVNNSAFTNAAARLALAAPAVFHARYKDSKSVEPPHMWTDMAKNMYIPFDKEKRFSPEYDGYPVGDTVKQADVILLNYPLEVAMTTDILRNNINMYASVTDPDGPAMTWSMFTVAWLQIGRVEEAREYLLRNLQYVRPPFYTWSEVRHGEGAMNFLTGMGGYLQSLTAGFLGIRVQPESLEVNPTPLEGINLRLYGVKYQSSVFNIILNKKENKWEQLVELISGREVEITDNTGTKHVLTPGSALQTDVQKLIILLS